MVTSRKLYDTPSRPKPPQLSRPLRRHRRFRFPPSRARDRQIAIDQFLLNKLPPTHRLLFGNKRPLLRMDSDIGYFSIHSLHLFGLCEFLRCFFGFEGVVEIFECCCGGDEEVGGSISGALEEAFRDL